MAHKKPMGRPRGSKGRQAVDANGHTSRDRNMVLGLAKSKEGQTRCYRALRTVCETLGIDPLTVQRLQGEQMRLFQWEWTEEMKRLARTEADPFPWKPEWDKATRSAVYEFHRTPITTGEHERKRTHDPEKRTAA